MEYVTLNSGVKMPMAGADPGRGGDFRPFRAAKWLSPD